MRSRTTRAGSSGANCSRVSYASSAKRFPNRVSSTASIGVERDHRIPLEPDVAELVGDDGDGEELAMRLVDPPAAIERHAVGEPHARDLARGEGPVGARQCGAVPLGRLAVREPGQRIVAGPPGHLGRVVRVRERLRGDQVPGDLAPARCTVATHVARGAAARTACACAPVAPSPGGSRPRCGRAGGRTRSRRPRRLRPRTPGRSRRRDGPVRRLPRSPPSRLRSRG